MNNVNYSSHCVLMYAMHILSNYYSGHLKCLSSCSKAKSDTGPKLVIMMPESEGLV